MLRSLNMQDLEKAKGILKAVAVVIMLDLFFYRSLPALVILSFVGYLYYKTQKSKANITRNLMLAEEFKECLLNVSNSLNAGYSIENAFIESKKDMEALYGKSSVICDVLDYIRRGLVINISIEELLKNAGETFDSREIKDFAAIFSVQKRSGGNLSRLVSTNAQLIEKRLELRSEINAKLRGINFEMNVMRITPFAMIIYISISYPGYLEICYGNLRGVLAMSACLALYIVAYLSGERILMSLSSGYS